MSRIEIECPMCQSAVMREERGAEIVKGSIVSRLYRCPNCLHEERVSNRKDGGQ